MFFHNPVGTFFVDGDSIDEILSMERGSNRYFYHYDGLGSVTEITDSTGAVAENYTYDAYGNPSVTTSTIGNPYRFTGREFDEESEIYHYRARAYDSTIGRFLQRDPLEYEGGMNMYEYAYNNPTNFVDPDGELAFLALLPLAYAAIEIGLSAADAHSTGSTLLDPCASLGTKAFSSGLFLIGALAPGGGYSTLGKTAAKKGSKITTVLGRTAFTKKFRNKPNFNILTLKDKVWKQSGWARNKRFLDKAVERGDDIYVRTKNAGKYTFKEIKYLQEKYGYQLKGNWMVK